MNIEPVLLAAMQEDSVQFDKVIIARQIRDSVPKESRERRQLADNALNQLRIATDIPLKIAEVCLDLAGKAIVVFDLGFQAARGDSGVAISSALAGASGAISIIYLNLTSFKGSEWAIQTRQKADELSTRTQKLQMELFNRISQLQNEVVQREPKQDVAEAS